MAAARIVSGTLREIWQELVLQAGGPPVLINTGIRVSAAQLSRLRGLLVVNSVVGVPAITAVATVSATGFLQVAVGNIALGTSFTWTLDVELTHSVQQSCDPAHGPVISIVNGSGVGGGVPLAQTLAQTYDFGAAAVDQTMVIDTAKGGGIIIDATTAVVTAPDAALEVWQNVAQSTPVNVARWGADTTGPLLQLTKSRGTPVAPAAVQVTDTLGILSFRGRTQAGAYTELARLEAVCASGGPTHSPNVAIHVTDDTGTLVRAMTMQNVDATGLFVQFWDTPYLCPDADATGRLGIPAQQWSEAYIHTVHITDNAILGGAVLGGGALHTVLLPNDATMPVPQADQVYIGSNNFGVGAGTNLAVLAVSAEEPAVVIGAATADHLIPILYNGVPYYLLATEVAPG